MGGLANLAGPLVLSILVGVRGSLRKKYAKQHNQGYGQNPG